MAYTGIRRISSDIHGFHRLGRIKPQRLILGQMSEPKLVGLRTRGAINVQRSFKKNGLWQTTDAAATLSVTLRFDNLPLIKRYVWPYKPVTVN